MKEIYIRLASYILGRVQIPKSSDTGSHYILMRQGVHIIFGTLDPCLESRKLTGYSFQAADLSYALILRQHHIWDNLRHFFTTRPVYYRIQWKNAQVSK